MVELEQRTVEPLTFTNGEKTAGVPHKDTYNAKDVTDTLAALGIKQQSTTTYKLIHKLAPNSRISTPHDRRVRHSLTQKDLTKIIEHSIEKHESATDKNVHSYTLPDAKTIEISRISHRSWEICRLLLDELLATRNQTESGAIQTASMPFEEVQKFFLNNMSYQSIFRLFKILNIALNPSGWSLVREGKPPRIPSDAPWSLRQDDNSQKNPQGTRSQSEPNQENTIIYDRTITEQKKRMALKQFDPTAFGTSLLLLCVSNLTNPEAKEIFTKDVEQFMSSCLPADLKLDRIIGSKTPKEYFQGIIKDAINGMAGKSYEELSEIQQKIMPLWNELRINSGQHPKTVIFEHFSGHDSNKPLDQGNNDAGNSEEDIIRPKRTRGRPFTSVRAQKSPKDTIHF